MATRRPPAPPPRPDGSPRPASRTTLLLATLAIMAGCAPTPPLHADTIAIPVTAADGTTRTIPARLCRPAVPAAGTPAPARLVVLAHGSPGAIPDARARFGLLPCDHPLARTFTAAGYAVLYPLRRGYGPDALRGVPWSDPYGDCESPDYVRAAVETARDTAAAIAHARTLPGIRPEGVALIGQSAGGWGALYLAAHPPPGLAAVVNAAGGRGGRRGNRPNDNCSPDRLVAQAALLAYGNARAARGPRPTLWLYAANDSFFAPSLATAMHAAYTDTGGRADLRLLPPFGADGHDLLFSRAGPPVWAPIILPFLAANP